MFIWTWTENKEQFVFVLCCDLFRAQTKKEETKRKGKCIKEWISARGQQTVCATGKLANENAVTSWDGDRRV